MRHLGDNDELIDRQSKRAAIYQYTVVDLLTAEKQETAAGAGVFKSEGLKPKSSSFNRAPRSRVLI